MLVSGKLTEPVCLGLAPPILGMSVGTKIFPSPEEGGGGGGAGAAAVAAEIAALGFCRALGVSWGGVAPLKDER